MGMFDDLIPSQQGATPRPAAPSPDMSMFADLLPKSGNPAAAGATGTPAPLAPDYGGDRPLTIRPRKPVQIEVDPVDSGNGQGGRFDLNAIRQAASTLDPANTPSMASSAVSGALQGATFNMSDELKGLSAAAGASPEAQSLPASELIGGIRMGAEALAPDVFGQGATDRYNQALQQARAENTIAQQANPGSYLLGELGGGLVTAAAAPVLTPFKAADGANLVSQGASALGNLAVNGAAYGAPAGFGGADGGIADRLKGAAQGAALGGVVNPAFGTVAGALGGTLSKAVQFGQDNLLARNDPQVLADRIVGRAFERDNTTPDAVVQQMTDAPAPVVSAPGQPPFTPQGPPAPKTNSMTAADVAGPNTQGLAGTIMRTPGPGQLPARALVDTRQVGSDVVPSQGDRVSAAIDQAMGGKSIARNAIDQIMAKRSAEAAPFYEAGFNRQVDYGTPEGQGLLSDLNRVPGSARSAANRIMQIEGQSGSQLIYRPNDAGEMELAAAPNPRQFDYIKRGLDNQIEAHTDALTGRVDTEGHALSGLKRDLLANLDKAVPELANARRIYAGHSEMIDAIRSGKDAFRPSFGPHEMAQEIAGLRSAAEKEAYKMSAAQALKDSLGKMVDGADKARAISKSPAMRAKVEMLAPDDVSKMRLMRFIGDERAMADMRSKQLGNSATAERLGSDRDFNEHAEGLQKGIEHVGTAAHAAHAMASGGMTAWLAIARHLSKLTKINPEMRGAVLDEARKIILNPDPAALRRFEQRVQAVPPGPRAAVVGTLRNFLKTSTMAVPRTAVQAGMQQQQGTPDQEQRLRRVQGGPRLPY